MNAQIAILNKQHNKKSFKCGVAPLDDYIQLYAKQDISKKLAQCFVLTSSEDSSDVLGYYTLATSRVTKEEIPEEVQKKLKASYSDIPAIILGRLAVDSRVQGKGYGEILLIDALKKAYGSTEKIGAAAVVVDPINQSAERFYTKYGFIKLPDSGRMFLTMQSIAELFAT